MSDETTWPVIVTRTQTFVIGVKGKDNHAAAALAVRDIYTMINGQDPVQEELDSRPPDRSELTAYAEEIAFETDDTNF